MVGWALSEKPEAKLVIKMLDMAYDQRGRNSDLLSTRTWDRNTQAESFARDCGDTACVRAWVAGEIARTTRREARISEFEN
jgi:hypothetical protein